MRIRFENPQDDMPDFGTNEELNDFIENLIDNYLFEYSKRYPESKITSKITNYSFWKDDLNYPYLLCDRMNVEYLALDVLNDESIISCQDSETGMEYNDWFLLKNYEEWSFEEYISDLRKLFNKTVEVEVENHQALGTGKYRLPIVKASPTILTYHQAQMFEVVSTRDFKEDKNYYAVNRGMPSRDNFRVEQEVVEATQYHDKELLAYFFSALRDKSPLTQFRNFYNVLEFFFEDAPQKIGVNAKFERDMIKSVFAWAIDDSELKSFLNDLPSNVLTVITSEQTTTSGITIKGIDFNSIDIGTEVSERIYEIRNACIHSKKTRKGSPTARFVPTSKEEDILKNEFWLMHWLAVKIIEKDTEERC